MSGYIRVEGHSHLMRDGTSGAIVNTNTNEMKQARIRKSSWKKQQNEIKQLRNDLSEMKELLNQMIEVNNGRNSS
tara:strand:- start:259 stop:483 length:225 start_codon:yes stop_codon:yes gene_type:complete